MDWAPISAIEMAKGMQEGSLTSERIVGSCLERIRREEERICAWTFLDPDYALAQARRLDAERRQGRLRGRLHGIPVAVKDIFDTSDMPTENGTVLHAGRQPERDATVVSLLRSAGAVILGKTVTTELALYKPGKTRNPHHIGHTPGGSSIGSAAAVAVVMVPLAIGSQTNGSVIRPASFCGVIGFKPSYGTISRHGALKLSGILDQVGLFARSLEDTALLAEELMLYDPADPDMRDHARRCFRDLFSPAPSPGPSLAFVRSPAWPHASEELAEGFAGLVAALGGHVEEVSLPAVFDQALLDHKTIMEADISVNLGEEYRRGADRLSPLLCEMIERGRQDSGKGLSPLRPADSPAERGAGRPIHQIRRHRCPGDSRLRAQGARVDGRPDLLLSLDPLRGACPFTAPVEGPGGAAGGGSAGGPEGGRMRNCCGPQGGSAAIFDPFLPESAASGSPGRPRERRERRHDRFRFERV